MIQPDNNGHSTVHWINSDDGRCSRRRKWGHAYDDERAPTGEVYGYDKRHGREAAWDVVQRHEMVGVFKWPAMRGSKAMHHLPDCVKEYFTSATDAAEADPKARRATTTKTNCR